MTLERQFMIKRLIKKVLRRDKKKLYTLSEDEYKEYLRARKEYSDWIEKLNENSIIISEFTLDSSGLYNAQILFGKKATNRFKEIIESKVKEIESLKGKIRDLENRGLIERILNKKI